MWTGIRASQIIVTTWVLLLTVWLFTINSYIRHYYRDCNGYFMYEKSKDTRGKHPDIPFLPCWMRPRSCVLLPSLVSMSVHIYPIQSLPLLSGLPFNVWFIRNEYGGRNWRGATIRHSLTGCSKTRLHKVRLRAMEYLEPIGPGTSCAMLLCPEEGYCMDNRVFYRDFEIRSINSAPRTLAP